MLDRTITIENDENFSRNIFTLIRKSLYIYQLMGLSTSIPFENAFYDEENFKLCSVRTLNQDVVCDGGDISMFLQANNTKVGREGLQEIDPDVNGADIAVIFLRNNKSMAQVNDPCSLDIHRRELQGINHKIHYMLCYMFLN